MLEQLICTWCSPHRELKNNGQVNRISGQGVFSISRELISKLTVFDCDFLESRLYEYNASSVKNETGLFHSYEYYALTKNKNVLSSDVVRSNSSHRGGVHVKQFLIGNLKNYPVMWFGASAWNAHLKPEKDYYLDDNEVPDFLQPVSDIPEAGYITVDKVRAFVNDGRAEAVKAGIWFLIQEYSKKEEERKVLLIKDVPENVELWIAAIEFAFSVEQAQTITFSTNKAKIEVMGNSALFYYTDEYGNFCRRINTRINQIRHPYCMIVGYHPKDNFSASIRQIPRSEFAIIDGTTKKALFSPNDDIKSLYYSDAVKLDADFIEFCESGLPSIPMQGITFLIPKLYEAYKYVLHSDHKAKEWTYNSIIEELSILLQFGPLKNNALNKRILNAGTREYPRFEAKDRCNNYKLLKLLWSVSTPLGRNNEVSNCLRFSIIDNMENLKNNGPALSNVWNALNESKTSYIIKPLLYELFKDEKLYSYIEQFNSASVESIVTVMEMYIDTFSGDTANSDAILSSNDKLRFVCKGLANLIDHKEAFYSVIKRISGLPRLLSGVAASLFQYLQDNTPDRIDILSDVIIDILGGDIHQLINNLCDSKEADIGMIEYLLAYSIKMAGRCDQRYITIFKDSIRKLDKKHDTGWIFYSACIKVAKKTDTELIIQGIRNSFLERNVEKKLFREIDASISYDTLVNFMIVPKTITIMKAWARELGEESLAASIFELRRALFGERKTQKAIQAIYSFGKNRFALPNDFFQSKCLSDIVGKSVFFHSGEFNMAVFNMFVFSDKAEQAMFIKAFIRKVLDSVNGKRQVNAMIAFYETFNSYCEIPGFKKSELQALSLMIRDCFRDVLSEYYNPVLEKQILALGDGNLTSKKGLCSMLHDAAGDVKQIKDGY